MKKRLVKLLFVIASSLLLFQMAFVMAQSKVQGGSADGKFETRCGWFENPTPANIWFYDKDGEWTIGVQGGYQVEKDWDFPEFKRGQWVSTNGNYGYGCACLQVKVDKANERILEIKSARARPLAACRRDPALKKLERTFK